MIIKINLVYIIVTLYNLDYYQINHNGKISFIENNGIDLEEFLNDILFKKIKIKNLYKSKEYL